MRTIVLDNSFQDLGVHEGPIKERGVGRCGHIYMLYVRGEDLRGLVNQ
jgi:hypothetical protein